MCVCMYVCVCVCVCLCVYVCDGVCVVGWCRYIRGVDGVYTHVYLVVGIAVCACAVRVL